VMFSGIIRLTKIRKTNKTWNHLFILSLQLI
jgi:hypothetical protein